jgi:hypothetical protein
MVSDGKLRQLSRGTELKLTFDAGLVKINCFLRYIQNIGDYFAGPAFHHQSENLALTGG